MKKKVLLMGKSGSGKTSMRSIIFANYIARDTMRLGATIDVENSNVKFLGGLVLNLWDCVSGEAQVTLANGLSYSMQALGERQRGTHTDTAVARAVHGEDGGHGEAGDGLSLQSWGVSCGEGEGDIVRARMARHLDKRQQHCMALELEDGRVLYMTPDHEILRTTTHRHRTGPDTQFCPARSLSAGDYVVCSAIEGVSDDDELQRDLSSDWGIFQWRISSEKDRNRILAFARLCGAMQDSIRNPGDNDGSRVLHISSSFDEAQIVDDIRLAINEWHGSARRELVREGSALALPEKLLQMMHAVHQHDGIDQLPVFIDDQTPRSVLREFIAAWWGQKGSSPHMKGDGQLAMHSCSLPVISRTVPRVRHLLHTLLHSNKKCDFNGAVCIDEALSSNPGTMSMAELQLSSEDLIRFVERIGIRYSVQRLRWFNAAAAYVRAQSRHTSTNADTPFETAAQFFDRIGFDCIGFDCMTYEETKSTFQRSIHLRVRRVLDTATVGKLHVYDIQVPGTVSFVANGMVVHNCGGQDAFMETYLESQRDHIFRNVEVLIYVFDIESRELKKDLTYYHDILEAIMQNSKSAKVFCLIHKMDLIPEDQRERVFRKKEAELKRLSHPMNITCFKTSIWDETLYKAWSTIVYSLIPNVKTIEANLDNFTQICGADEVVLFERATFLVIAHSTNKEHHDVHRFEKISNIIKQFKLSCMKSMSQFQSMEVQNTSFSAYIEGFTPNTYIMVVVSDESIQSATVLLNIKAARRHFGNFLNATTNAVL